MKTFGTMLAGGLTAAAIASLMPPPTLGRIQRIQKRRHPTDLTRRRLPTGHSYATSLRTCRARTSLIRV